MTPAADLLGHATPQPPRLWVPEDYVDEMSPKPRAHPTDWLVALPGGGHALDADHLGWPSEPERLADGAIVAFAWTAYYGRALVTAEWTARRMVCASWSPARPCRAPRPAAA